MTHPGPKFVAAFASPRSTSYWHHIQCPCGWSRGVQLNAKPARIRKNFREAGEHFAAHRDAAIAFLRETEVAS